MYCRFVTTFIVIGWELKEYIIITIIIIRVHVYYTGVPQCVSYAFHKLVPAVDIFSGYCTSRKNNNNNIQTKIHRRSEIVLFQTFVSVYSIHVNYYAH